MDNSPSEMPTGLQINPMPALSLQTVLARSIDYAGLFPPAELSLETALVNYREYLEADDAWMLSGFVLPTGKFSAAADFSGQFDRKYPLRISALGAKSDSASDFRDKVSAAVAAIRQLRESNGQEILVSQLEIALPPACNSESLDFIQSVTNELGLRVFCEAPAAEAERVIDRLAGTNAAGRGLLGFKLRTGGVTADAFPTSAEIARALVAAARTRVPIKFTAGLHHPVRQFRDEVKTKMHGFLNVLGAGILAAEFAWDEAATTEMLDSETANSFVFAGDTFAWREWKISSDAIRGRRERVVSFGSCSFDEPRDDLRSLGLLL
jgi:hypothetical protein